LAEEKYPAKKASLAAFIENMRDQFAANEKLLEDIKNDRRINLELVGINKITRYQQDLICED